MQVLYVNTASTTGGDGTTNATAGAHRAYPTVSEALTPFFGTTLSTPLQINCSGVAPDTAGLDHTPLEFLTTPTNYLEIIGDNTTGVWNDQAFRFEVTNQAGIYNQYAAHVRLTNLQVMVKTTNGSDLLCYRLSTANNDLSNGAVAFITRNCIARRDPASTGAGVTNGYTNSIAGDGSLAGHNYVINCLAYDFDSGSGAFNSDTSAWVNANLFHWNCTSVRNVFGFVDCLNVKNSIAANNSGGDFITVTNHDYNASTDGSASGAHSRASQTITFRNAGNNDFHLSNSDSGAKGFGLTDPSGTGVYSDDIDGQTRSGSWDIGCDQTGAPSCALSGTVTASIVESDIVTGGKVVTLTLTNDAFLPDTRTDDISVIGTPQSGTASGATQVTLTFDVAPLENDVVIVWGGHHNGGGSSVTPVTSGYTSIVNDTGSNPFFGVWWKRMGASPDSTVVMPADGTTNNAAAYGCIVLRGCLDTATPIGATATAGPTASTNPNAPSITTTADNSVVLALAHSSSNDAAPGTVTNYTVFSSAGLNVSGQDASVSGARRLIAASGTASDPPAWSAWTTGTWKTATVEILRKGTWSPFDGSRSAIATGLDSAQSEAAGWDAKVKPNIPVGNVVRTSPVVCTVTLQAQSDYDITAQETITATLTSATTNSAAGVTASPTFTIDASGGGGFTAVNRRSLGPRVGSRSS